MSLREGWTVDEFHAAVERLPELFCEAEKAILKIAAGSGKAD